MGGNETFNRIHLNTAQIFADKSIFFTVKTEFNNWSPDVL